MALGKIASLGLGSQVLTQKVLDDLKAADQAQIMKPIKEKITTNATRQKDFASLKTLISTFKSSVSTLADETTYQKRTTNTNGKSATLSANSGVSVQDIEVDVKQLAQRDVYQTTKFAGAQSFVGKTGTFGLKFGDKIYDIEVKSSTTLEELAAKINDVTKGAVQAKILKVGGDKPYQLILQSKETGADNKISFSTKNSQNQELSGANDVLKELGWDNANVDNNHLTKAQNAEFTYNGISITRNSNEIKDLTMGINLSLKEKGKTTFSIKEDHKAIKEEMNKLVSAYNNLVNNLKVATDYNKETRQAGTFQGVTEIRTIESTINKVLFGSKTITKDNKAVTMNLAAFGLGLNKEGLLELKSSKLDEKLNSSSMEDIQKFFTGGTVHDTANVIGSSAVSGGALKTEKENFVINGKKIELNTPASNDSKQNALALLKAINEAKIPGLQANLTADGDKIMLKTTDGTSIEVKGKQEFLDKFGLSAVKIEPKSKTTGGFFSDLKSTINGLIGKNGSLTKYSENLTSEKKKLEEDRKTNESKLDAKYNTMAERFLAYDKIIAKLSSQLNTMTNMINSELNSKK
ncbi:MAG: flagellar filament capping protein FliD [Campylobacter sp.]